MCSNLLFYSRMMLGCIGSPSFTSYPDLYFDFPVELEAYMRPQN